MLFLKKECCPYFTLGHKRKNNRSYFTYFVTLLFMILTHVIASLLTLNLEFYLVIGFVVCVRPHASLQ